MLGTLTRTLKVIVLAVMLGGCATVPEVHFERSMHFAPPRIIGVTPQGHVLECVPGSEIHFRSYRNYMEVPKYHMHGPFVHQKQICKEV